MAHEEGGSRGVLELARSATPVARRQVATLAAVARPAGEVAAFLLVQILRSPRAREAALGLARSLARRVAGGRGLPAARVEGPAIAWRVTVEERSVSAAGVLVRRVEAAMVRPYQERPPTAR